MHDRALGAILYFGSAITLAILAAAFTSPRTDPEPRYEFVQVDAGRCLADTASDVLVATDNVPVCVPDPGKVLIANRTPGAPS